IATATSSEITTSSSTSSTIAVAMVNDLCKSVILSSCLLLSFCDLCDLLRPAVAAMHRSRSGTKSHICFARVAWYLNPAFSCTTFIRQYRCLGIPGVFGGRVCSVSSNGGLFGTCHVIRFWHPVHGCWCADGIFELCKASMSYSRIGR